MKNIIDIRLKYVDVITEELTTSIESLFLNVVEKAKDLGMWDDSITNIVVTDNLSEEVNNQAEKWSTKTETTKAKEYFVISKVLFNQNLDSPEHVIFIDLKFLINEKFSLNEIIYSQILGILAKKLFPKEILEIQFSPQPRTLDTYITVSAIEWIKTYYTLSTINQIFERQNPAMNHNSFLTAFKRSLKRDLFKYNTDKLSPDENIAIFWENYYGNFHNLFLRISENETDINDLLIKEEGLKDLIYGVFEEIKKITSILIEDGQFEIINLKEKIKNFSAFFEVHLVDENDKNFRIKLTKNPKEYFKDLIDTEQRIVCFIDILGFSDFVNQYDKDVTSTFLQDIQESFAIARKHLLDNKSKYNEKAVKHLEYQTFSDNICISIPYFDNENDFLSNFNILSIYVRGLQMIMMSKGFFMRGGISIGSYYADDNIIFSKGLINAYKLESEKAIYPRILVDKIIIKKILNYKESHIDSFGLKQAIIFDWEGYGFLNPIGLINSSIQQFNSLLDEFKQDNNDEFSSLLNSITKTIGKLTTDFLETASTDEKETLTLIKAFINQYLLENQQNEKIYTKYLWLGELLKWIENEESERLKFYYLSKCYEKEK